MLKNACKTLKNDGEAVDRLILLHGIFFACKTCLLSSSSASLMIYAGNPAKADASYDPAGRLDYITLFPLIILK